MSQIGRNANDNNQTVVKVYIADFQVISDNVLYNYGQIFVDNDGYPVMIIGKMNDGTDLYEPAKLINYLMNNTDRESIINEPQIEGVAIRYTIAANYGGLAISLQIWGKYDNHIIEQLNDPAPTNINQIFHLQKITVNTGSSLTSNNIPAYTITDVNDHVMMTTKGPGIIDDMIIVSEADINAHIIFKFTYDPITGTAPTDDGNQNPPPTLDIKYIKLNNKYFVGVPDSFNEGPVSDIGANTSAEINDNRQTFYTSMIPFAAQSGGGGGPGGGGTGGGTGGGGPTDPSGNQPIIKEGIVSDGFFDDQFITTRILGNTFLYNPVNNDGTLLPIPLTFVAPNDIPTAEQQITSITNNISGIPNSNVPLFTSSLTTLIIGYSSITFIVPSTVVTVDFTIPPIRRNFIFDYFYMNGRMLLKPLTSFATTQFIPSEIPGMKMWLDATDSTKITSNATSNVQTWTSKFGESITFSQETLANRPIMSRTASGNMGVFFRSASNNFMTSPAALNMGNSALSMFSVFSFTDAVSAGYIFSKTTDLVTANNRIEFARVNRDNFRLGLGFGQVSEPSINSFVDITHDTKPNELEIMGMVLDRAAGESYGVHNAVVRGMKTHTIPNGVTSGNNFTIDNNFTLMLGAQSAGGIIPVPNTHFNGGLGEFMLFSTTLTTMQRKQLEGYFAWKWGKQNTLPPNHIFEEYAPS